MTSTYPFTNLVFEGGGVKGIAFVGALEVLDDAGILDQVKAVAGTSAGAITAALIALGYTPKELGHTMLALDLTRFEDGGLEGPARIIEKFGWYRGDAFLDWLGRQVEAKLGFPSATFAQLVATTHVDLNVVATEVSTQTTRVFSAGATPDMSVAEAVRMSMSIPFFFAAVRFQAEVYVDGGAAWNYPVEIFDGVDPNWATLGLHLENAGPPPPPAHIGDLVDFAKYLYESVMAVQGDYFTRNQADRQRSVMINDLGIRATDFGITLEQKNALIAEGRKATQAYLGTWGPAPPP